MKKFILTIFLGLSLLGAGSMTLPVNSYAQSNDENFELTVAVKNPLGDKKEFKDILSAVLKAIMEIVLPIVIVMVIYSGFLYVMARGKPEAIEKAHKTLTWTLIGAAILLGAQLIATVLVDTISNIGKDAGVSTSSTQRSNLTNNNPSPNTNNPVVASGTTNNAPSGTVDPASNSGTVSNTTTSNNSGTGFSNGTNVAGSNTTAGSGVSSTPVATTKYYVNATSGAKLRSEPNLTSSYQTKAYGTVLDVSGETNGFFNIYNTAGTSIIGYISKSLLTQGNTAPSQSSSSSSGISTYFPDFVSSSITPNNYFNNLTFVKKSSAAGSVTGNFGYTALNDFTPYNGIIFVQCLLSKGNGTFAENILKNNVNKKVTKGTYTSPTYTISGVGDQKCVMYSYKDGTSGKMYLSNMVTFSVK